MQENRLMWLRHKNTVFATETITLTKIFLIKEEIYLVIGKDYHDGRFEMMMVTENCVDPVASHNWIILCSNRSPKGSLEPVGYANFKFDKRF